MPVVSLFLVLVMDNFMGLQLPSQHLLHHNSMFMTTSKLTITFTCSAISLGASVVHTPTTRLLFA